MGDPCGDPWGDPPGDPWGGSPRGSLGGFPQGIPRGITGGVPLGSLKGPRGGCMSQGGEIGKFRNYVWKIGQGAGHPKTILGYPGAIPRWDYARAFLVPSWAILIDGMIR